MNVTLICPLRRVPLLPCSVARYTASLFRQMLILFTGSALHCSVADWADFRDVNSGGGGSSVLCCCFMCKESLMNILLRGVGAAVM